MVSSCLMRCYNPQDRRIHVPTAFVIYHSCFVLLVLTDIRTEGHATCCRWLIRRNEQETQAFPIGVIDTNTECFDRSHILKNKNGLQKILLIRYFCLGLCCVTKNLIQATRFRTDDRSIRDWCTSHKQIATIRLEFDNCQVCNNYHQQHYRDNISFTSTTDSLLILKIFLFWSVHLCFCHSNS
jgi:hypothetical protein